MFLDCQCSGTRQLAGIPCGPTSNLPLTPTEIARYKPVTDVLTAHRVFGNSTAYNEARKLIIMEARFSLAQRLLLKGSPFCFGLSSGLEHTVLIAHIENVLLYA
jgi:hypothetical protein